ncbi:hypothetical protein chiPu_0017052 [Chiloscyllium punctatum]|uniref:Uncharacterized protein n=1 Tax=Chiloscyllium punctatum TaxID=137246 RepID=A0A401T7G1_CHIPU|nr:hypothetical protein [Chiloscyllium punctatum]
MAVCSCLATGKWGKLFSSVSPPTQPNSVYVTRTLSQRQRERRKVFQRLFRRTRNIFVGGCCCEADDWFLPAERNQNIPAHPGGCVDVEVNWRISQGLILGKGEGFIRVFLQ